jgi:predicted metal-binding membrane protein
MTQGRHGPDGWLVAVATTSLLAWSMLALGGSSLMLPVICSANLLPVMPLSASFGLVLVFNAPAQLAGGWALMLAAMMLPLVIVPLRHVRERSLARRRGRATLLFVLGYLVVWMTAGIVLQLAALVALWTLPLPWMWPGLALAVAMLWQVSPAKQWCLNRCHRKPQLAAFEPAADRDALLFGLTHGASCLGACWTLMLAMLLAGKGQFPAMIAITLLLLSERLESPAPLGWRWRGGGKAMRIIAARLRLWAGSRHIAENLARFRRDDSLVLR